MGEHIGFLTGEDNMKSCHLILISVAFALRCMVTKKKCFLLTAKILSLLIARWDIKIPLAVLNLWLHPRQPPVAVVVCLASNKYCYWWRYLSHWFE